MLVPVLRLFKCKPGGGAKGCLLLLGALCLRLMPGGVVVG